MKIETVITNYENGNLTDAKNGAKDISLTRLYNRLREFKDEPAALRAAIYLKGETKKAKAEAARLAEIMRKARE